jgi:hypothetical protein
MLRNLQLQFEYKVVEFTQMSPEAEERFLTEEYGSFGWVLVSSEPVHSGTMRKYTFCRLL